LLRGNGEMLTSDRYAPALAGVSTSTTHASTPPRNQAMVACTPVKLPNTV
jgi:hypothetical protein